MNREQATRLAMDHIVKLSQFFRKHFKGVKLNRHQLMALMSLSYSSRWEKKPAGYQGPTLIGPKITSAIRTGDWEAAAWEIEHNSLGGQIDEAWKKGMQNRRTREAAMFRGVTIGNQ